MKSRFMFLVQRRGGSQLWNRLLGQVDDQQIDPAKHEVWIECLKEGPPRLPVEQEVYYYALYSQAPEILAGVEGQPILDPQKNYAFMLYAEEESNKPTWSASSLEEWLPQKDWEVFFMVRDGRNHITSPLRGEHIVAIASGQEKQWDFLNDLEKFEQLAIHWNQKATLALEAEEKCKHFHIVHYEEMIKDPFIFLKGLLLYCNMTPTCRPIETKLRTSSVWTEGHSSTGKMLVSGENRFEMWSTRHWQIYDRIMKRTMQKLGYIKG